MARGVEAPLDEAAFNELTLEVFRYQVRAVPVYGRFVANRGIDPALVTDWRDVPAVPTRAFRRIPLVAGDPDGAEAVFRTSGTTGDEGIRGTHRVLDLGLYRASLLPMARRHLHPDGGPLRVAALTPPPTERPDSSLAWMAGVFVEEWDAGDGGWFVGPEWELEWERLKRALEEAAGSKQPLLLVGTAFAFVHVLDRAREEGWRTELPAGSRLMETGGFKGRSREVPRATLYAGLEGLLSLPMGRMVNEYGMTELLSQWYEPVLDGRTGPGLEGRFLVGPPWLRTRILDPDRLTPVEPGTPGLLQHLDLANLYSVSAVLTEDLGVAVGEGFRVLGRREGAVPRGCSLSMAELLSAREGS